MARAAPRRRPRPAGTPRYDDGDGDANDWEGRTARRSGRDGRRQREVGRDKIHDPRRWYSPPPPCLDFCSFLRSLPSPPAWIFPDSSRIMHCDPRAAGAYTRSTPSGCRRRCRDEPIEDEKFGLVHFSWADFMLDPVIRLRCRLGWGMYGRMSIRSF